MNPLTSPLRFGLIGCGGIGTLRAAALAQSPYTQLTAVSDAARDRAAGLGARYGAAVAAGWRELLHRADIDAVVVSTPPALHAEMCVEALRAGKHVLCEKPLARNPGECRAILDAARAGRGFLATGFNFRFFPSVRKARELFDSGLIGELDHIRSYAGYSGAEHNPPWVHDHAMMGGGALRDNGIHLIDLTRYFLGEVAAVKGFASSDAWKFPGCEDNGMALLRSVDGKLASLQATWTEWRGYRFRIEIYGTRGCIRTSVFPMFTQVVWSAEFAGRTRRRSFFFPMTHLMEHLRSYRWVGVQSFVLEFEAFCRAVRGEATRIATGLDGARAVEIAHAAVAGDWPASAAPGLIATSARP